MAVHDVGVAMRRRGVFPVRELENESGREFFFRRQTVASRKARAARARADKSAVFGTAAVVWSLDQSRAIIPRNFQSVRALRSKGAGERINERRRRADDW